MTVTDIRRRFGKTFSITICILALIKEPDKICYERCKGVSKEKLILFWVYTRKYSTIVSGATTIESAVRAPDDIIKKGAIIWWLKERQFISANTWKIYFSTIASGATPIGSAGRAPDEILTNIKEVEKANRRLGHHRYYHRRESILIKVE
jgi:hypothetical protein